jgi:hypothetical protein
VGNIVRQEPMLVIGVVLNVAVVMIAAFAPGLHLTPTEMSAVVTISTALTSAAAAFLVVPAQLGVINAAVSTILVASAAFGLHMMPYAIALVTASVSSLLSYLMREKVSPVASVSR